MKTKIISILISIILFSSFGCRQKAEEFIIESGTVFNTVYHIKYQNKELLTSVIDSVLKETNRIFNPFDSTSMIYALNNNKSATLDSNLYEVLKKAEEISLKTNGRYDVTAAPLINLWGFGFSKKKEVTQQKIDSLKEFVGYNKIHFTSDSLVKEDARILINLSSIAKGYICDCVGAALERYGVKNYMVEIGGEISCLGLNPEGKCWHIGIDKPDDNQKLTSGNLEAIVSLCGRKGLATSGNYRNFYIKDGKKYAHTIDPLTGYPAENSLLSATVIAENCMIADGLATAFMVIGVEDAQKLAEEMNVDYFLIYTDSVGFHKTVASEGMKEMLQQME